MKMSTRIDQFSYAQKLAALVQLYFELRLPLAHALRAAEADLSQPEDLGPVIQTIPARTLTTATGTTNRRPSKNFFRLECRE